MKKLSLKEVDVMSPVPEIQALTFLLKVSDYRHLVYFYSFGQKAAQSVLLLLAWAGSTIFLILEKIEVIGELEPITHNCLRLVCVLIPLLVATTEFNVFRFRKNHGDWFETERTVAVSDRGISFSAGAGKRQETDEWSDFLKIQETGRLFIISRSLAENFIIPKRVIKHSETIEQLRTLFSLKLGSKFLKSI